MVALIELFIARSDGKQEIISTKGGTLNNGPTAKQLSKVQGQNGSSGYYQAVEHSDSKSVEWRRKLGGLLMREVGAPGEIILCPQARRSQH